MTIVCQDDIILTERNVVAGEEKRPARIRSRKRQVGRVGISAWYQAGRPRKSSNRTG